MVNRVLLIGAYSVIEPLGLIHLAGLARDLGWEKKIHLVRNHDYSELKEIVRDFRPQIVGANVYTGNHLQLREAFTRLKIDNPNLVTVVGGPHPTYFPLESAEFADFVVMSEGFRPFERILRGTAKKGVLPIERTERFPFPDRKTFYQDYPEHAKSPIKSLITMTGCPYTCSYCYNSSGQKELNLSPEQAKELAKSLSRSGRLFPKHIRDLEDVLTEAKELVERWPTSLIYFQDDVFGFDISEGGFLERMVARWPREIGIPFHAQMRWEMTGKSAGSKRLDLIRQGGASGITLAIESNNPVIRREVLNRNMEDETIFEGMVKLIERGFKVRTEQITGLPYGATSVKTPINLEADLDLLDFNVKLKALTGGPTMAWASTFAPYQGTVIYEYCKRNGFYAGDNSDISDTFFDKSALRFLRKWVGPTLKDRKNEEGIWLDPQELADYRARNALLRAHFNFFAFIPEGGSLAREFILGQDFSIGHLGKLTRDHVQRIGGVFAENFSENLRKFYNFQSNIPVSAGIPEYFSALPHAERLMNRFLEYSSSGKVFTRALSDSVRHHLYENVLYGVTRNSESEIPTSRISDLK